MTAPGPRAGSGGRGRANQRHRTRKDLLVAAAQLSRDGHKPSLEAVAEAARVSRATAYRYFPSIDALLVESALDLETPTPQALFGPGASGDPVARLEAVDAAFEAMITANEGAMRLMLAETVRGRAAGGDGDGVPARQNRRTPLIDGALEPLRGELKPGALRRLRQALAVMIGTEAFIVCRDVLGLDDAEARRARRWAIRALVEAARRES
ncbi:MAG: TetR/AcrR family transcriptional regulator [Porticoccaceae bacterium]